MGNAFVDLPATAGDGTGAAQGTSLLGRLKTVTVNGTFKGSVTIELSLDGGTTWADVASFSAQGKKTLEFAADQMRVRRAGSQGVGATPNIDVAADDSGARFDALPAPVGNGTGGSVDVSTLGTHNTVTVAGTFSGVVHVEISEDGTDWVEVMSFAATGQRSSEFVAQFMRVRRSGVTSAGTPVVNVGAINDAAGASGGYEYLSPNTPEIIFFVNAATGDDNNDGLSLGAPFLTIQRAFNALDPGAVNLRQVIELAGTFNIPGETLVFPPMATGQRLGFTSGVSPTNYFVEANVHLRATPVLALSVVITGSSQQATSNIVTYTTSTVLVPGAHVGQQLIGANPFEYALIVSNGVGTIEVAKDAAAMTAPVGIFDPGAEIIAGDPAGTIFAGTVFGDSDADVYVTGIRFAFTGGGGTGLEVASRSGTLIFQQCQIEGYFALRDSVVTQIDSCHFEPSTFVTFSTTKLLSCFFDAQAIFDCKGENIQILGCVADACGPIGSAFDLLSGSPKMVFKNTEVRDGTAVGVRLRGGQHQLDSLLVDNCVGSGIELLQGAQAIFDDVAGTNLGGFGAVLRDGAQVDASPASVTGATNDVDLGGSGATAWAAVPATDVGAGAPQFCRIY